MHSLSGPIYDDLAKAGFTSKPRQSHGSDFYLYHPAGLCGLDVEFWPWFPCGDDYAYYGDGVPQKGGLVEAKQKATLIDNLKDLTVEGITIKVPEDSDAFLTAVYGNWKVPQDTPGYDKGSFEILTEWLDGLTHMVCCVGYSEEESKCLSPEQKAAEGKKEADTAAAMKEAMSKVVPWVSGSDTSADLSFNHLELKRGGGQYMMGHMGFCEARYGYCDMPENTLKAAEACVGLCAGIEIDVQQTKAFGTAVFGARPSGHC